jgi:serine protein kinase
MEGTLERYAELYDQREFKTLNEELSFEEYVERVKKNPRLARNAFQYMNDMIMSKGTSQFERYRRKHTRYHFFTEASEPIFGLEDTLEKLVNWIQGAAGHYGAEKRVLLLHGPVGSAKSTICRDLKRGLEEYSKTDDGAWYTFKWVNLPVADDEFGPAIFTKSEDVCVMNEDPIKLMPLSMRQEFLKEVNEILVDQTPEEERDSLYDLRNTAPLNPRCKNFMNMLLKRHDGDWLKVVREHVRVIRRIHSETDRVGIGTFQPKDEKNQDSTELTGDMNFGQIGHFGKDSDPRAFNFDGEFCVANRGMCEFIEMLKLAKEFLYDLLGASQEHQIKPKKFSQVVIDEVIIAHSVAGHEPLIYRKNKRTHWTTFEKFYEQFSNDATGVQVLAHDFASGRTKWAPVVEVTRHKWTGEMVKTKQKWGVVETTPNHALYDRDGHVFYPESQHEVMAVRNTELIKDHHHFNTIDLIDYVPEGVFSDRDTSIKLGHKKVPEQGYVRSVVNRAATSLKQCYSTDQSQDLKDLLTYLTWYLTEGHISDGQVVISQSSYEELDRVRQAVLRICDHEGHISEGSQTDSCWRLIFGSRALVDLADHLCGRLSENKRLPDFVFDLPREFQEHVLEELNKTDGSVEVFTEHAGKEYKLNFSRYKTVSPVLAAQVGHLYSLLDKDYSVSTSLTTSGKTAYEIRYVKGFGGRGGRHLTCRKSVEKREVEDIWVYDIECEGLHNFACGVGQIIAHNTNNPEYEKLKTDKTMEALRDRTTKIDVPYQLRWSDEIKIYEKDYGPDKVKQHIMPHTLEVAAFWAILTRLEDDSNDEKLDKIDLRDKLKLYDGKSLPGWTEDSVKELRDKFPDEGMLRGMSPRYVQDKISNCLAKRKHYINVFHVLGEIKEGLNNSSLITDKDDKKRYEYCVELAIKELDDILKNEVQKALGADEKAIERVSNKYVDNLIAYVNEEKIEHPITHEMVEPDERLMRSIEEQCGIPEQGCDDFRRSIAGFIGTLSRRGKEFRWDSNPELKRALQKKVFEDLRDTIKISNLTKEAAELDPELQERIDAVKTRLINQYGYNDQSATDVLEYVASIFARGDSSD